MTEFLEFVWLNLVPLLAITIAVCALFNSADTHRRAKEEAADAARKRHWLIQYINSKTR